MESAAERNPEAGAEPAGTMAMLRGLVPQILTALAGTLGTVGFVAVVGGAITWNRFNAVELPADQAVAAFPEAELVAIGVSSLVVFLLIGAGAVVMIKQIEQRGPCERRWGLLTLVAGGMVFAIWLVPDRTPSGRVGVSDLEHAGLTALIFVAWALAFVLLGWRRREQAQKLAWLVFGRVGATDTRDVRAWLRARLRRLARLRPGRETGGWFRTLLTTDCKVATARLMMILFGAELLFAWLMWVLYDAWLGATLLIGGVLGAICLLIADRPGRQGFAGYGLAIFASVIVFGGATEAMRARYRPEVQPAALIRTGEEQGKGICGLYVTENDDRVYIGRLRPDRDDPALPAVDSGRIFFVDKERVSALSIGPLMSIRAATARASELRAELVVDSQPAAPPEETVVVTRRFERRGIEVEQQRTRVVSAESSRPATQTGSAQAPPQALSPPSEDRELAARRAEAELSCAPAPVSTD